MKVAVYYRNDDIRIEDRPIPSISDYEILVKMKACGICGTDVMEWYRIKKAPRVLGHEMAGEIVDTGNSVKGFRKGDRVFVSHHVPCYKCRHCTQNNYTACESLHTGNYDPGGFAEYIRAPEENVKYGTFILPESLSFDEAAMIEPMGCAIAGQNIIDVKEDQTVLIIGSGISGILHIQLSKLKRAKVIVTDVAEDRLKKAKEFGADYVIDADKYTIEELKRINNNKPADVVIVCAAAKNAIENALSSVDRKGKILFFAVPETDMTIPSQRFWRDEISLFFSYGAGPAEIREAIDMIDKGLINAKKMITHKVPLSEIMNGFRLVSEARNSLKVIVVPDKEI
jgi:L-iditol 2-dehydrogenase